MARSRPPVPTPAVYPKRRGYRHGYVKEAAVQRGLELVEARGPAGLTLRGVARDLGVTPGAVVYHFGNLEGLRQAVADAIIARMAPHACMNGAPTNAAAVLVKNGLRWVDFAADHPDWYAFAAGVAWRRRPASAKSGGSRFGAATTCIRTTRRAVHGGLSTGAGGARDPERRPAERAALAAASVYAGIHGLAMARADGHVAREHALPFLVALATASTA